MLPEYRCINCGGGFIVDNTQLDASGEKALKERQAYIEEQPLNNTRVVEYVTGEVLGTFSTNLAHQCDKVTLGKAVLVGFRGA